MKRLISILFLSTVLIFSLAGCGSSQTSTGGSDNKVYTLKFADYYTPTHLHNQSVENFIKTVEEKSNGRIKIQRYPSEQLGKVTDMLSIAKDGTADIATVVYSYSIGQIPLSTVVNLPDYTTSIEGTEIMNRVIKDSPEIQNEYKKYNIKPFMNFAPNQNDIGTSKKPVKTPEDLKGLKIASSGGLFDKAIEVYGAIPIIIPSNEKYEAIQKGIVEGSVLSFPSVSGLKLNEIEKYHTAGLRMGANSVSWVINLKTWEKLPADLQKIIEEAGQEVSKETASRWDKKNSEFMKQLEEGGMTIHQITPEERAKWDAPLKAVDQAWVKEMNDKGLPGQKVYDLFGKTVKEVAK